MPDPDFHTVDAHRINIQAIGWAHLALTTLVVELGYHDKERMLSGSLAIPFPAESWSELTRLASRYEKLETLRILEVDNCGVHSYPLDDKLRAQVIAALPDVASRGLLQF